MQKPVKRSTQVIRILLITASLTLVGMGVYLLILSFSPKIYSSVLGNTKQEQDNNDNKITIKSAGINVPIKEGGEEQLEKGAWHRFADRGNPEKGGNFILSAHSFVWGYTPQQINEKSFFYNLKDVRVGDEVVVHYNSKDYTYTVESTFQIQPTQTDIEDKSDNAKLTIYTCTEGGSADGRVVVVARPT